MFLTAHKAACRTNKNEIIGRENKRERNMFQQQQTIGEHTIQSHKK